MNRLLLVLTCTLSPLIAGEFTPSLTIKETPPPREHLIPSPVLYENTNNPFIQRFALTGIYHGTYGNVSSNSGKYSDFENRVWRMGVNVKFLTDWELRADINVDDEFDPFYGSLNDVYAIYKPNDDFKFQIGRMKPLWGSQWRQSIKTFPYFEWGQLVNQLRPTRTVGASIAGRMNHWFYEAGVWSGDVDQEFGDFDKGAFYTGCVGYDFTSSVPALDRLEWHLDLYLNGADPNARAIPGYDYGLSTYLHLDKGNFSLTTDFMHAGGGQPDAYGVVLAPSYRLTERLELLGRYQYSHANQDSLLLENRYDRFVNNLSDGGQGSEGHSIYLGANYHVDEDRLKFLAGVKWSTMDDDRGDGGSYDGWTLLTGLRLHF